MALSCFSAEPISLARPTRRMVILPYWQVAAVEKSWSKILYIEIERKMGHLFGSLSCQLYRSWPSGQSARPEQAVEISRQFWIVCTCCLVNCIAWLPIYKF